QVKDLTRFLDPGGLGVISFEDFYRGITAISNGDSDSPLYEMGFSPGAETVSCPEEYDDYAAYEQNEVTDSAYLGSESTYSECETFTDEDTGTLVHQEMHEEVETDSAIDAALSYTEEGANGHLHQTSTLTLDSIEDLSRDIMEFAETDMTDKVMFLEKRVSELEKDSAANGEQHTRLRHENLQLVHRANALEEQLKEQESRSEEALLTEIRRQKEVLCKVERERSIEIENLQARLQQLDEENSELQSCLPCLRANIERLEEERRKLQDQVEDVTLRLNEELESRGKMADKLAHERHKNQKEKESTQEGPQLHAVFRSAWTQYWLFWGIRVLNYLENWLICAESPAQLVLHTGLVTSHVQRLVLTVNHFKSQLTPSQRVVYLGVSLDSASIFIPTQWLQQLDEENSELQSCLPCLRANIERLEEERRKLQDQVEDVTLRLNEELESRGKMADKLAHERHKNQKEKESTQELIEDLRKQLELLQLYKLEAEARRGRSASAGLQEYNSRTREAELEQEVRRLKQDNCSLKEQNDELNGQIINLSIQGAKNLFSASFSESLAAEINSVSRDELMEAIHKQEDINLRLQEYIDRIIVAIMESNPSILEVK
ncbi:UNVERIFIED_CONTAM: hypothetical protein FKN15_010264, partial [Acipenser sinensis]